MTGRVTHGLTRKGRRHPLFGVWADMHKRCTNAKAQNYPYYGGRGIAVCSRWSGPDGFPNFLADMGARPANHTLDRIDNDGGYSPQNCRWATRAEQTANRRPYVHRGQPGELNGGAKLSGEDVRAIRAAVASGAVQREVASAHGVSEATISLIVKRQTWRHI